MMSAAASLGLSLLWDTDVGINHVDKYSYSTEENIKVCLMYCLVLERTSDAYHSYLGWSPPSHWHLALGRADRG
jgi:hypothetical protein